MNVARVFPCPVLYPIFHAILCLTDILLPSIRYYQKPSSASPFFLPLLCAKACRSYISAIWNEKWPRSGDP